MRIAAVTAIAGLTLAILSVRQGASSDAPAAQTQAPVAMSVSKGEYEHIIESTLENLQLRSIYANSANWTQARDRAVASSKTASSEKEAVLVMLRFLREIGDEHAFPVPKKGVEQYLKSASARAAASSQDITQKYKEIGGGISYVSIPAFASTDPATIQKFSDDLSGQLITADARATCGWIIDLRENSGGNMWPMATGVSQLLNAESFGSFQSGNGTKIDWWNSEKGVGFGSQTVVSRTDDLPALANSKESIAVLVGPKTSSSGEAMAVAFHGRPNTLLFGDRTRGLTTSTERLVFSDQFDLFVSTSRFVDRTGHAYSGPITPDVTILNGKDNADAPLKAAIDWLHHDCKKF
ncbi:MAG TPA: S41 family peptidase [Pseudoxanthomonas sp.]